MTAMNSMSFKPHWGGFLKKPVRRVVESHGSYGSHGRLVNPKASPPPETSETSETSQPIEIISEDSETQKLPQTSETYPERGSKIHYLAGAVLGGKTAPRGFGPRRHRLDIA